MSKELAKNGYQLKATKGGFLRLAQQYPMQFTSIKDTHGKPAGFVPGANQCEETGYNYGSEITTVDGKLYKCVDPTSRQAVWIEIPTEITEQSYGQDVIEPEEPVKVEPKPKKAPAQETVKQLEEDEEIPEAPPTTNVPVDAPIEEFDSIPFHGFIVKNDRINKLGDLIDVVNAGTLEELSYINEERAKQIKIHLKGKGFI